MSRTLCSVLLVWQALSGAVQASQQCYFPNGTAASSSWGLLPCQSDTTTTTNCCTHSDYCTSNGLCLDSDGDNRFTTQGCTNSSWDGCTQACKVAQSDSTWPFRFVFTCETDSDTKESSYCCDESTCCASQSGSMSYNLSVATNFWRPPGATGVTTSTASTSTSETGSSSSSGTTQNANTGGQSDNSQKVALGLGLGLGLPLAAVAAAAAYMGYRGWRSRIERKTLDSLHSPSYKGDPQPAFTSYAVSTEMENNQLTPELGAERNRYELASVNR